MKTLTPEFDYLGRKYQAEIVTDAAGEYSIDEMWFYAKVNFGSMSRISVTDEELSLYIREDSDNLFTAIDAVLAEEVKNNV